MGKLEIFLLIVSLNLLLCSAGLPISSLYEDVAVESSAEESYRVATQVGGCDCKLTLYDNRNYGGISLLIIEQNADFGWDWYHDRADSAKVEGPCTWIAYYDQGYLGQHMIIDKDFTDLGSHKNQFSAARVLPPPGTVAIAIFEHSNYNGRMVVLYDSIPNLSSVNFQDSMSSFIVIAGTWTLYEHPNYYGRSATYGPGTKSSGPGSLGHDTLSSVKKR